MFVVDHCHDVSHIINVAKLLAPALGLCHEF